MKKNSLKDKVWFYLSMFSLFIVGGILSLQIVSLGFYFEWSKVHEIKNIANKISSAYNKKNYNDILDLLAFREDVCIEIHKNNTIIYSTDSISRGCLINNSSEVKEYKSNFITSNKNSITYRAVDPKFNNKALIYGIKVNDDTYAFISTSLEPINSTVTVLKSQLIFIILIVLIFAFIIAYTISKKISKPIEQITETSKKMSKGNYDVVFKTGTDIKEINELENTLNNAAVELSKTESIRRELLANVSHDLKTPLTLIKANAEMVKDLTFKNKEKREKNLDTIIEEVDRLNLLVEDILDLSKMQANSVELNYTDFDLDETIKTIIERFNVLCDRDQYKIDYEGFSSNVTADKKKIEQVIYNLINNAINYTGDDKMVYIKLIDIDNFIRVEVRDTGVGIDKEDIDYIWDKYYKVDKKYKRVSYGTGLGLSIVKNILILHGFKYGVETIKNKGTCFYFEIEKNQKKLKNVKKCFL